jgi:hypothetical protein
MPISIDEYREPKWIRFRERYGVGGSTNKKDRFYKFESNPRAYRGGVFKQPGYNPNHQSISIEKVNLESDDITLKPR